MKKTTEDSVAVNESSRSIKQDFFKKNQEFLEKGIESSITSLRTSIYSSINSTFSNFNNDYEKKLDTNREIHEKAISALNNDLKNLKDSYSVTKSISENELNSIEKLIESSANIRIKSRIFTILKSLNLHKKINKKRKNIIIEILKRKRIKNILNSWRNITNILLKGRIKLKYHKLFNDRYAEMQSIYMNEIKRMTEVLNNLELDIEKEMDERRALARLYDTSMNKGVEVFIKETNAIVDFNSSSKKYY
jgi:hypothetical protein